MVFDSVYFTFCIIRLILWDEVLTLTYAYGQSASNIALHKPAFQQNTFISYPNDPNDDRFDASNAVDGLRSDLSGLGGQCSLSVNNKTTATWWVNLTRLANIHYIIIYYRTDNAVWDSSNGYTSRFLGFSVYVSNTTSKIDGTLCFKDNIFNTKTIPAVFNVTCAVYGQYVIYYNERLPGVVYPQGYSNDAFTDICEFEVYECANGYYGYNCTESCGNCIDPAQCSPVDGSCPTGCMAGYVGRLCKTECKSGNYGLKCNETCGHCSDLLFCSHVNGTCLTGCKPGYEGERCQKVCKFGNYGIGCRQECSSFCKTSRDCDHVSGICTDGCRNGWQGDDCFEGQPTSNIALHQPAFQQNTYTLEPYKPDSGRFDASNAVDGLRSDLNGLGGQCSLSADDKTTATWWVNLTRLANIHYIIIYYSTDNVVWDSSNGFTSRFLGFSIYVSNTTSKIDGALCYKDNTFNTETIPAVFNITCAVYGQYVIYYNERLPGLVYPHGYSKYAHADICELEVYECDIGYYGYNCTETCGHCVDEAECSPVDGTCSTGCSAGYFGQLCKTECKSGKYGLKCNETCGHCSDLMYCSHVNGTCLTGCKPGYEGEGCQQMCKFGFYGIGCHQECSSFCKTSRDCNHVSGACRNGCRHGWQGDDCFDVSNIHVKEDCEDLESKFHGFAAAFCISLALNCVLIAIILMKRLRRASPEVTKDQVNEEKYKRDNDVSKEASNETSYQELGEINKSETYESCQ